MANLMLSVMGAFAEFERSLIRERQREGIALAKQRGAYQGRKKTLTPERAAELVQRAAGGVPKPSLPVTTASAGKRCTSTSARSHWPEPLPRHAAAGAVAGTPPALRNLHYRHSKTGRRLGECSDSPLSYSCTAGRGFGPLLFRSTADLGYLCLMSSHESPGPSSKPFVLLGSGFSKAVFSGMPTLAELSIMVLERLQLDSDILQPFAGDLEQWLSFLSTDQPWLDDFENLSNRSLFLRASSAVKEAIDQSEAGALATPYPAWLKRLVISWCAEGATVVTFNYDLLIERVATELPG